MVDGLPPPPNSHRDEAYEKEDHEDVGEDHLLLGEGHRPGDCELGGDVKHGPMPPHSATHFVSCIRRPTTMRHLAERSEARGRRGAAERRQKPLRR